MVKNANGTDNIIIPLYFAKQEQQYMSQFLFFAKHLLPYSQN